MTHPAGLVPSARPDAHRVPLGREVRRGIRLLLRWPLLAGAAALVLLPSVVTLVLVVPSYALVDGLDLHGLRQR